MYLGFDGSTDFGPYGSANDVSIMRDKSFVAQMRRRFSELNWKTEYWDGPHRFGYAVDGIIAQGVDFYFSNLDKNYSEKTFFSGFSRGGLCALNVINEINNIKLLLNINNIISLNKKLLFWRRKADLYRTAWGGEGGGFSKIEYFPKIDLEYVKKLLSKKHYLILLDPVGMSMEAISNIKPLVESFIHFRRTKISLSRPIFINIKYMGDANSVHCTHPAIGGMPGASIDKRLCWQHRDFTTVVNLEQDMAGAQIVANVLNDWLYEQTGANFRLSIR